MYRYNAFFGMITTFSFGSFDCPSKKSKLRLILISLKLNSPIKLSFLFQISNSIVPVCTLCTGKCWFTVTSKSCYLQQEVRSQIPNSLIPSEYHIVKNPGVMGLEFQEEYVHKLLYFLCVCQIAHLRSADKLRIGLEKKKKHLL